MADVKNLAKDTAVYGVSSILGRFLNWCLVPLYTYVLANPAEYGVVTNLYAWTALLLVILTYGMETGLFRFINREDHDPQTVYSTTLITLFTTSALFAVGCTLLSPTIAGLLGYDAHPEYISMLAIIVAMDAFDSIPFAYLRYRKKPFVFAGLKLVMIFVNIIMNLFFLLGCPWLMKIAPHTVDWFYNPDYGVGYVFVANFVSTLSVTIALLPYVFVGKARFSWTVLREMLGYSLPLLVLGIVGIMNQTIDRIIFPFLFEDKAWAATQLGIYGACFKVAMVMMMFTQAFRYAYEPFIFAKNKDADSRSTYADTMKFYVITSLLILLGMMFYLDILKWIISDQYWEGLVIIPFILVSYLFQGIYFNLSLWYKLTDRTQYGAYMSAIGCAINVALIFLLAPVMGYIGLAVASLASYTCMMLVSYFLCQKYMPIAYDLRSMGKYCLLAVALVAISLVFKHFVPEVWLNFIFNTILLIPFVVYLVKTDLPLSSLPVIGKKFKKK